VAAALLAASTGALAAPPRPVTIANTPVPVQGTVTVGNPVANPVNVRAVDEPARQAFTMICSLASADLVHGNAYCYPHLLGANQNQGGNIPAGKRFVIEMVSGLYVSDPGIKPAKILLETGVPGGSVHTFFHAASDGPMCCFYGENWTFVQPVKLYADPGPGLPSVRLILSAVPPPNASGNFEVFLVGYLVNL
jgi:hypothetical protein